MTPTPTPPERRVICDECSWRGTDSQILRAANPFDTEDTIDGCPECKAVSKIHAVCDEPNCWSSVACGRWTDDGYRLMCSEHGAIRKDEIPNQPTRRVPQDFR